jgi:hypothetical protein
MNTRRDTHFPTHLADVKHAAVASLARHGSLVPTITLFTTRAKEMIILSDLPEEPGELKRHLYDKGAMVAEKQSVVIELFVAGEAWVRRKRPSDQVLSVTPDSDREEALVISSVHLLTKQQRCFLFRMLRDQEGNIERISEEEELESVANPLLLAFVAGYVDGIKRKSARNQHCNPE